MSYKEYTVNVYDSGDIRWYQNGQCHREDGPAVEYADGSKFWYRNGQYHREDGPAVEYADGDKCWYRNGQYHREDGPALETANGSKFWYLNGKRLTEQEFLATTKQACAGKVVEVDGVKYVLTPIE